jgi:hypothetical protein
MYENIYSKILKKKDNLEKVGVDGMIVLNWSFRNRNTKIWTGFKTALAGSCEVSGSIEVGNFLTN